MSDPRTPVWAILLVKAFQTAKSRLATVLSDVEREVLARAMFERLLGVLIASPDLSGVLVATDSAEVEKLARRYRAEALRDPADARTLAEVVDAALADAAHRGARAAIVMVSDLPEATGDDVARLIAELGRCDVVLSHDARGAHTNALGLRLGTEFRTSFGSGQSAREHEEAAARARLSLGFVESPTLAFDVDTPEDYALLLSRR